MNVLVTGGAGFIGSHVVDLMFRNGINAIVVDNLSQGIRKNINPKAKFYKYDVVSKEIEQVFAENQINSVIHLAAQINARASLANPVFDARENIIGSLNLLELAKKHGVKKFVYASSVAVYGEPKFQPCKELHPIKPTNNYGISKYAVEQYLSLYNRLYGLDYVCLRYANVYGPRQNANGEAGVVSIFIDHILKNQPLTIHGDGTQTRDFVFVEDVAKATFLALTAPVKNKIINVSSETQISINQLVEALKKIVGRTLEYKHTKALPGDIKHMAVDSSRAKKELGWEPTTLLNDGLKRTMDSISLDQFAFI